MLILNQKKEKEEEKKESRACLVLQKFSQLL